MNRYLIDTNALIILIKKAGSQKTMLLLQNTRILDLTFYEAGNAILEGGFPGKNA